MMQGKRDIYFGLFNDSFPPVMDGVTLTVKNYAEWLLASGFNPCVVTPDAPVRPLTPYQVMRYFSLPIASRHPYRYGYPRLDFTIKRRLRTTPFALVHAHSPFSAGRLARYTARTQGVPLIGTFHSKYRTDLEHSMRPWMVKVIMRRILDFFNSCDQVWIPQAQVEHTVREYGYRGELQVVENGNDMAHIPATELPAHKAAARRRLGLPSDRPVLLFVGQHILEKGVEVILDALLLLRERGVAYDMHYIGTGYAAGKLAERVRQEGVGHCVHLHGLVEDRQRLADFYAAADLFLFPSFYDNAPLVVREAAAMGTPAVIPAGSTASEVIADGSNGLLCERSPRAYADVIECVATGRQDAAAMGLQARNTLVRSWDNVMQEVAGRYHDIISQHRYR